MLLDANVLLAAIDLGNPDRDRVAAWLKDALEGPRRIAIPWQTIGAFVRIATHPRVFRDPLSHDQALNFINACLASPQLRRARFGSSLAIRRAASTQGDGDDSEVQSAAELAPAPGGMGSPR